MASIFDMVFRYLRMFVTVLRYWVPSNVPLIKEKNFVKLLITEQNPVLPSFREHLLWSRGCPLNRGATVYFNIILLIMVNNGLLTRLSGNFPQVLKWYNLEIKRIFGTLMQLPKRHSSSTGRIRDFVEGENHKHTRFSRQGACSGSY